jgi:hypothetical protein
MEQQGKTRKYREEQGISLEPISLIFRIQVLLSSKSISLLSFPSGLTSIKRLKLMLTAFDFVFINCDV